MVGVQPQGFQKGLVPCNVRRHGPYTAKRTEERQNLAAGRNKLIAPQDVPEAAGGRMIDHVSYVTTTS